MENHTGDLWKKAETLRADDFHAGNPEILHRALQNHIEILQGQSDPAGASYAATVVDLLDISLIKFDTSINPDKSIQEIREAYTGFESLQGLALGILKSSPSSDDLEQAIRYCNLSLDIPDRSSEDMATSHRILGHTYLTRFRAENNMKDLDEARKAYDEALTLCPKTSSSYHLFLAASAHVHLVNFNFTGATQDQHSAIHLFRRALDRIPSDHPSRPRLLMHTGCAIATRFGQLGQQGDLQDAMKLLDEARNTYDDHHPDKPYCLSAYATALQARYLFSRKLDDLDNALAIHRSIIDRVPELSDKHVGFLSGLSLTLHAVADTSEGILRRNYLQEGVDNAQKAVELADAKNPRRPFLLGEAAHGLYKLFKVTGELSQRSRAISLLQQAESGLQGGRLAFALTFHAEISLEGPNPDLDGACDLLARATSIAYAGVRQRFEAAVIWAGCVRPDSGSERFHPSAPQAYSTVMEAMRDYVGAYPAVETRMRLLQRPEIRKLASLAAFHAIHDSDLELAVQRLEEGTSPIYSGLENFRSPLEDLEIYGQSGLAKAFQECSSSLEIVCLTPIDQATLAIQTPSVVLTSEFHGARMNEYQSLHHDWETLLASIRQVPGFERFLKVPEFPYLRTAASKGPIILAALDNTRSHAIILTLQSEGPHLVRLSEALTSQSMLDLSRTIKDARSKLETETDTFPSSEAELDRHLIKGGKKSRYTEPPPPTMMESLRHLWRDVCKPVVAQLSAAGVVDGSRIWWCPPSEMIGLPLHAAGPHADGERDLIDIYVSSYTINLSTLINARRETTVPPSEGRTKKMLIVGQSDATGLDHVGPEIQNIHNTVSRAMTVNICDKKNATKRAVTQQLKEHEWVHFACHGALHVASPFQACFQLSGKDRLTVLDIMNMKNKHAELAFLATCHSAEATSNASDRTITLATAMQFIGFKSVIGTLVEMPDSHGPIIAAKFYENMLKKGDSAYALHEAVKVLRGRNEAGWTIYIHIGP